MKMLKNNHFINCPLCGMDNYQLLYSSTESPVLKINSADRCNSVYDLSKHGDIMQCRHCGMVYNNPQPDPVSLLNFYRKASDPLYLQEKQARECMFKHSLEQVHEFITPPGKLLDVGCFTGIFMKVAASMGWKVEGIELSSWAADLARKTGIGTIYEQPLEQILFPENSFDVITLWDVIEHLSHPVEMLTEARRVLKPGGILAFNTHMVDSLAGRISGKHYPFFMIIHLIHFSRTTVTRMLNEHGYELLDIKPHLHILRIGYFLEELSGKVKSAYFRSFLKRLSTWKKLSNRFIKTRLLGVADVFARKK